MSQKDDMAFEPFDQNLDDYDSQFAEKEPEKLDDVRGESDLAKTKKIKPKGQKALMVFLIFAGLIVCGLLFAKMLGGKETTEVANNPVKSSFDTPPKKDFGNQYVQEEIGGYDPMAAADMPETDDTENKPTQENVSGVVGAVPEPTPIVYEPVNQVSPTPAPAPIVYEEEPDEPAQVMVAPPKTPEELRQERRFGGFESIKNSSVGGSSSNTGGNPNRNNDDENRLASKMSPTVLEGTSASRMSNRDFVITKGNTIDCVLNTKFDSSVVGMITCTVTRNIYGASGRVVLIDRGSKVTGEYQGGIQQGDNRVFVLWNRIETPKGVMINIDSPAAGSLGEAGVEGRIDSKFWRRFGGAMLVSLVSDLGRAASEAAAEKTIGGNVTLEDSSDTSQQMAMTELERSINIPPSLIKHQGDRLSIYVARDVYFGNVYGLKAK